MKVSQLVDVPKSPQEVLVRPDGKVAYVSCDASQQVAAIELQTFKVEKLIAAGKGADGLAWAARP
jgi:DNA-binding beta-propeller fold protein YncE